MSEENEGVGRERGGMKWEEYWLRHNEKDVFIDTAMFIVQSEACKSI